jgi:hypothetical protein
MLIYIFRRGRSIKLESRLSPAVKEISDENMAKGKTDR